VRNLELHPSGLSSRFPEMPQTLLRFISDFVESKHVSLGWHHRQLGNLTESRQHYLAALRKQFRVRTLAVFFRSLLCFNEVHGVVGKK